jgi:hypothetical protein
MKRKWLPEFIKPVIRFLYYPQERAKVFREPAVKRVQNQRIKQFDSHAKKIILFLVPGVEYDLGTEKISGGIISIISFCEESQKLKLLHGREVVMSTFPKQHLLAKHTKFKNSTDVLRFSQLSKYFGDVEDVIIHIPEFLCAYFVKLWEESEFEWLRKIPKLHLNVLNQNVRLMPGAGEMAQLKKIVKTISVTTAHQQYCNQRYRDELGVPIHKLSVWISPEQYQFRKFKEKKNLLVVSPDKHPDKPAILDMLTRVPGMEVQVIRNLTYEAYKDKIAEAKWTLTFGEGLDGYFIEPVFSGAIAFAVYNNEFFTDDFKRLPTIYSSMDVLKNKIVEDIIRLDKVEPFEEYQRMQFDLCAAHYDANNYRKNIENFYSRQFTFP